MNSVDLAILILDSCYGSPASLLAYINLGEALFKLVLCTSFASSDTYTSIRFVFLILIDCCSSLMFYFDPLKHL